MNSQVKNQACINIKIYQILNYIIAIELKGYDIATKTNSEACLTL